MDGRLLDGGAAGRVLDAEWAGAAGGAEWAGATTGAMMPVLFHEMTHLWQFATGRCGRHDAAFRAELRRVGVDEIAGQVAPGSAVLRAIVEVNRIFPWLAGWLRRRVGEVPRRQAAMEECFFREHLESLGVDRGREEF